LIRVLICFFLTGFFFELNAQKETTWWYFVRDAGLSFESGTAMPDTNLNDSVTSFHLNGVGYGSNAITSISDPASGDLLFYASSCAIFNKNHFSFPNGAPLMETLSTATTSGTSAEDGVIIVPRPNRPNQYYFFYLRTSLSLYADNRVAGLFANLVDMELDNGLGDVVDTFKNVYVVDSTEEKIDATPHANGVDYWLMVRRSLTNSYYAYLITESGISATPVISSLGAYTPSYNSCQGDLRFNHQGDVFVHSRCCPNMLEIFDFDNATGQLSNLRTITPIQNGVGLEFSADDSKLYAGGPAQYDMTNPTQVAIQASETWLGGTLGPPIMMGLQMGLDGKIYGNSFFSTTQVFYVDVINDPNKPGFACNYQDSAVYLEGKLGRTVVPKFLSSYFKLNFYADTVCVGEPVEFYMNFTFIDTAAWNFGDPSSGSANTSTLIAPTHVYNTAGSYTVRLIARNGIRMDTVYKTIQVKSAPIVNLGPNVEFCSSDNDSVKIGQDYGAGIYEWITGSSDSTLWLAPNSALLGGVQGLGQFPFNLSFTNECGSDQDSTLVYVADPLSISLEKNIETCEDTFLLEAVLDSVTSPTNVLWEEGSTLLSTGVVVAPTTSVYERIERSIASRTIKISATNVCGTVQDSTTIVFLPHPDGYLPQDSTYCSDIAFYLLNSQTKEVSYRWIDGTTGPQYRIDSSGSYWLQSASECDTLVDTFTVKFVRIPKADLGIDTAICVEDRVVLFSSRNPLLDGGNSGVDLSYVWSTLETDSSIVVFDTGLYSVTITLDGCRTTDSVFVFERGDCYGRCKPDLANVITPNSDGLNDVFGSFMKCRATNYRLSIFNRWGQLVFDSSIPTVVWDGSIYGEPASDGVYFYVLSFTPEATDEEVQYRGSVNLVR
jgi:gliding motility-associated-like protein